ncbi:MAG: ABC transporter substrate-binding protein [Magnetococcales bacterium]|nr:ABC transporter substrate-binding protein [Magnetococcales bacterium]
MLNHIFVKITYFCLALLYLAGCNLNSNQKEYHEDGTITIGVAWPQGRGLFVEGAKLAVKEANKSGGVLGQKIELIIDEREEAVFKILETTSILTAGDSIKEYTRTVARDFSNHSSQVVAVTGHSFSELAFSASLIYQQSNMLFITPNATNVILTTMNFNNLYRMLPTNVVLGNQLARFAHQNKYENVVIYNESSDYALELSKAFSQAASEKYEIKVASQRSFFTSTPQRELTTYAMNTRELQNKNSVDAIFLFTSTSMAERIIKEFRGRGIKDIPFIGGEGLDSIVFWDNIKKWQEESKLFANVAVPTMFDYRLPENSVFAKKFRNEFGQPPDRLAAIEYDTINILLKTIQKIGTSESSKIADEIRFMNACQGLTGPISFQENGDIKDKDYMIKWLRPEGFTFQTLDNKPVKQSRPVGISQCENHDRENDSVVN